MKTIVVVGGGAGGLTLVSKLAEKLRRDKVGREFRIVLVDQYPSHVWKPLLHEVAAGSMDPHMHQLSYAAQAQWKGFEFQLGTLATIDRANKIVTIERVLDELGEEILPKRRIKYHTLVLAVGSVTNHFGVTGAESYSFALDSPADADVLRRRLIAVCTRAQHPTEPANSSDDESTVIGRARRAVNIVIVGAGATGVELAAEMRATTETLAAYGLKIDPRADVRITIVEAGSRILPALPDRVANATHAHLLTLGLTVLPGESVVSVTQDAVETRSGKTIPVDITVWAAGIKAPSIMTCLGDLPQNRANQLLVRPTLQSEGDNDIFAIGDCASCNWHDNVRVPPRAQAAHQQAKFLASALLDRIHGRAIDRFLYRDLGSLVSLGRYSAVGSLMGGIVSKSMLIEGLAARLVYRYLYFTHCVALHGWLSATIDALSQRLRRPLQPQVKLH